MALDVASKKTITEHMASHGLLQDFFDERNSLKAKDVSARLAWVQAYTEICEKNGLEIADGALIEKKSKRDPDPEPSEEIDEETEDEDDMPEPDVVKAATNEDLLWAYHRLDRQSVDERSAPSTGALGLWRSAKKDNVIKKMLYERVLPKQQQSEDENNDVSDLELTSLEKRIVDGFGEVGKQIAELCKCP